MATNKVRVGKEYFTGMKTNKNWSFSMFMYKNYGFNYTREQENKALPIYLNSLKS